MVVAVQTCLKVSGLCELDWGRRVSLAVLWERLNKLYSDSTLYSTSSHLQPTHTHTHTLAHTYLPTHFLFLSFPSQEANSRARTVISRPRVDDASVRFSSTLVKLMFELHCKGQGSDDEAKGLNRLVLWYEFHRKALPKDLFKMIPAACVAGE